MLSVKWPASPACDPATVEVKIDDLHRKLDQLLARSSGGSCPMCGACNQHSREQEATASQLSAQAKLLENLERKVIDLRTSLEELTQALEEKSCDKIPVPLSALQRRKSLPVRTSVDEVYVQLDKLRDQNIIQHTFNAPCGKGQEDILMEDIEAEGLRGSGSPLRKDCPENKAQHDPHLHKEVCWATPQPGTKTQNAAKISEAKSPLSQNSSNTTLSCCTATTTSKEMTTLKPNMCTPKMETNTPSPKVIAPPQKAVPTIPATKSTTATTQILPPKSTHVPVPFKATVSSPTTTTTTTSVARSTALATNQKIPAIWTAPGKTAPNLITAMSSNQTRLNFTENTAPPSTIQSLLKASLGVSDVMSQGMSSLKSLQSPALETVGSKVSQPNGIITKSLSTKDELLPPKTTRPPLTGLATSMPKSVPESTATENMEPGNKLPLKFNTLNIGAPVTATAQNIGKPSSAAQATKTIATKLSTLSPPTPSAATSFLKHIYSCPDSLQSLQAPGGKAESATRGTAPFEKPGNVSTGSTCSRPLKTGGIEIKISSAPERYTNQTKIPPKTCFKVIDDVPPHPAPFPHRCVSLKASAPSDFSIHTREVLGGGRFGKVHKCTENKTGLRLAAKIISSRSAKEKEMVLNEIEVMNQLNHANILQLFDAFDTKNQVVLVLEFVGGGELFERIVDESCPLTEVDAMVFVKQICEGVHYMHQMYVLHLDLKPENILCVNRSSHQIKIIDFGLARRYKPREKLRVSFGTPEFLAPEVVNFDFVSFPTDMWTLGVVTYMLLSGLSPFLGDDDSETLNNVLTVNWYFDEETFEHVSAEAKDFISNLLIKERGGRLSAAQCLKHPWLNNISEKAKGSNIILKSQVLLRKYMARRLWKKNYIAIAAANRFKKIGSSGSLTSLGF
ncbi:myosin light chain kinase 2, skeletal/cardiac muscle isoform X1 [Silurus meridionalis]|uniref:myosin light chain kinase 2, skeletal/cardiac muscle isoform X1 n=2 Tax=Silurus meridionalis TaxID=175797 RepID=UPI001EEC8F35|nr:myosin light chain kinase 2, skeletal/cardiac muscle isoform X1 [Silurus meridionalis]XP_046724939.1 myosin light chain kinase 2, skeletal/cardiac muscle isoform X1 [Silurus meridionalis]